MATNEQMTNSYNSGYEARGCGLLKTSCPFGIDELNLRCQWLGGFNDKDMEIG